VIARIDDGLGGEATAQIAASLARRLGARLLLATVEQAPPRTPVGGGLPPPSGATAPHCSLKWLASWTSPRSCVSRSAIPPSG
jgi:hypothetical protein